MQQRRRRCRLRSRGHQMMNWFLSGGPIIASIALVFWASKCEQTKRGEATMLRVTAANPQRWGYGQGVFAAAISGGRSGAEGNLGRAGLSTTRAGKEHRSGGEFEGSPTARSTGDRDAQAGGVVRRSGTALVRCRKAIVCHRTAVARRFQKSLGILAAISRPGIRSYRNYLGLYSQSQPSLFADFSETSKERGVKCQRTSTRLESGSS